MKDLDDVFDSDLSNSECERVVAGQDYQKQSEKISKLSYSEGFFETCDKEIREKYDEAFAKGKEYSHKFGEILGRLDAFISLVESLKLIQVEECDIQEMHSIKTLAESYQSELNEEIINSLSIRIDPIINKYLTE